MMMPADEVFKVVGEQKDVDVLKIGPKFREHFGVSQYAMERRLFEQEYRYINGKYEHIQKERRRVQLGIKK